MEKHNIFLFQVFDLRFFKQIFILQQCLNPNPYPIFFSDSDPAKNFGLFRIRIHNTGFQYGATAWAAEGPRAHLHAQGKLTTTRRENRKIRQENEILKANYHSPRVQTSDLSFDAKK
jgi:hypothetical protein